MKIAIHFSKGTYSDSNFSFNNRWITYCKDNNIEYKLVDAYQNDIIDQVSDCDAFMWHFYQNSVKDYLFAKQLMHALHASGKIIFPSINMTWHFDDKVAQKYLLEAIDAPIAESWVFYDKNEALTWLENADIPVVFKLRGGAGSQNVKLLKTKGQTRKYIKKAFGRGFSQYDKLGILKDRFQKYKKGNDSLLGILKATFRVVYPTEYAKVRGRDKEYIYFQKFMPNNDSDIRVIIIGGRAFAVKRMTREGDFRASGSGVKKYDKKEIDIRTVRIAFDIVKKLNLDCVGFDFIFDENNNPLIVEIGYGFAIEFYDPCPGYWDSDLNWHKGFFIPQEWMVDGVISKIDKAF